MRRSFFRTAALGFSLGVVAVGFAPHGGAQDDVGSLKARSKALDDELGSELRRLQEYLSYIDQTSSAQVVLGRMTRRQAEEELKRSAAVVYQRSFTQADLTERRREHYAAAEALFQQVEAGIASATRWPTDRPGQDYRAFASKEIDAMRRQFLTQRAHPRPLDEMFSHTLKIFAWTRGDTAVPADRNPFPQGEERVITALTQEHARNLTAAVEPATPGARAPRTEKTTAPAPRGPGMPPSPPIPVEALHGSGSVAPPTRSTERPSGIAVRGAPTAEEEAEMAKARKFFMEQAQAASSRGVASAPTASVANAELPPPAPRTSRIEDLPLAGLDASTQSSIRNAPKDH